MARYRLWLHNKNKKGQPLDESVLKAAEDIAPLLTRYRQHEIDCESTTNDILQSAVEAASDATRKKTIANPAGYLVSIYRRFVDKFLDHHKKIMPVDDEFLEDLANAEHAPSFEEWMHNRLVIEQLLKLMDPDTRRICRWRLAGYSESEIAKRLGITPNAVSVRFTRGFKEAAKNLLRGKRSSKRK
jgi:RNA polymerase sigma factor (sigma-70 family)